MPSFRKTLSVYSVLPPSRLGRPFERLLSGGLERLDRLSATQKFADGRAVFEKGSGPAALWIVTSGRAKLTYRNSWESRSVSRKIGPNHVCGITETIAEIPYQATLVAIDDLACRTLSRASLIRFLRDEPDVCADLLCELATDYYKGYMKLLSRI